VELDLRYNQLSALTPALGALSSLRALYLHCNKLAGTGLPVELSGCRALQVLDAHSNALTGMVPVEALASLPALQHVNLSSNPWDSKNESVDRVRRALPHCRAVLL
jgi:Leucine rich repeat